MLVEIGLSGNGTEAAMRLLDFLDSAGSSEWATNDEEWWRSRFPELPKEVLAYMMRVTDESETNGRCSTEDFADGGSLAGGW